MRKKNLSAGILTEMYIIKKSISWENHVAFNLKDEIDNVLKDISRFIDINAYDFREADEGIYVLRIKNDFINENIYDLLNEMKEMTNSNFFVNCLDNSEDGVFEKDKVSCMEMYGDFALKNGKIKSSKVGLCYPLLWLMSDKRLLDNVMISGNMVPIWFNEDEMDIEDATSLLKVLNIMKTEYFKSKLSKCLAFEILI